MHRLSELVPQPFARCLKVRRNVGLGARIALVINDGAAAALKHVLPRLLKAVHRHEAPRDVRVTQRHRVPRIVYARFDCTW